MTDQSARRNADPADLREQVRARYAAAARTVTSAQRGCCDTTSSSDGCCTAPSGQDGLGAGQYSISDRDALPAEAVTASLGCGNPLAVADIDDGDTVLDLGSGGGIDVLLSARRVGPAGHVYGLDMTTEMLELARANAVKAGATNAEFLHGHMEDIPLPDGCVDVVISNCVINLSVDKPAVFAETHRVLRPGGRIGITDVLAEDHLTPADRAARGDHVGCVAGALTFAEYRDHLRDAGFTGITLTSTHRLADGIHSAIVKAVKPPTA